MVNFQNFEFKTMENNQKKLSKYCIFAIQRSGSTWFMKLLDSHPSIKSFDELFLRWPPKKRPEPNYLRFCEYCENHQGIRPLILFEYLDNFLNNYPGEHEVIGFKIMYNQFLRYPEVLLKLIFDQYKIIHLVRENYLDLVISQANLAKYRLAHSDKSVTLDPLYLEPSLLLKKLDSLERKIERAKQLINLIPLPKKTVIYEDLCKNRDVVLDEIAQFLEVETSGISFETKQKKINKGSYQDKIENYDEVVKTLTGTRFENFLKEE